MTRADADALYAFLRTVEPVNQPNRPAEMEFPYNQRALLPMAEVVRGSTQYLSDDDALAIGVYLLKTGIAAHSTATGPMAEVVRGSTQYLSDDDALAIGVYLKTLPATPAATQRQAASARLGWISAARSTASSACNAIRRRARAQVRPGPRWPAILA